MFLAVLLAVLAVRAAEWRNVDASHYLGGRRASSGYLQGKVVAVCLWRANDEPCRALLLALEEIWKSFKTKPLVVLGGHLGDGGDAEQVRSELLRCKVSFPVYQEAGLACGEPKYRALPFVYVVSETGELVYMGRDDRMVTKALVMALTDMEFPRNVGQWRKYLDYELEHLPCRGFLRLADFRKKFPQEAKAYDAKERVLLGIPDLKRVAALVAFARKAKDPPVFGAKEKAKREKYRRLVEDVISKCEVFKGHSDPRVAQEAKNALADLRWALAAL